MPQMAPIMWLPLFLLFSWLFLLSVIKISNIKNTNMNANVGQTNTPLSGNETGHMNWKW
uniref:ATP synthase complex subunit 8 n=1 Tax=Folsomia candida TaxID=158441 RepID=A0A1S5QLN5_FOLCA|nr:ATP synthase F0 subunit 8 [Folsomia candida]AMM04644.1 ATP synthase F0 subunit 8 [Folsomia candida]UHY94342.1 ATP synthase F0 subunit 8 [Folsomia candida]